MGTTLTVYLSIPIRHCAEAKIITEFLACNDIQVLNPCTITPLDLAKEAIPFQVAQQCWQMIERSEAVVLFCDYYGRDCAAEMGYAIARGKPIFPLHYSQRNRQLHEDWMIKPFSEPEADDLSSLVLNLRTKLGII
ncbi:MAG: hypothetical protein IPO91_25295 [Chloroflexi bacterium]|nr:hypothetical protein [Chloroflexota bacterium]